MVPVHLLAPARKHAGELGIELKPPWVRPSAAFSFRLSLSQGFLDLGGEESSQLFQMVRPEHEPQGTIE